MRFAICSFLSSVFLVLPAFGQLGITDGFERRTAIAAGEDKALELYMSKSIAFLQRRMPQGTPPLDRWMTAYDLTNGILSAGTVISGSSLAKAALSQMDALNEAQNGGRISQAEYNYLWARAFERLGIGMKLIVSTAPNASEAMLHIDKVTAASNDLEAIEAAERKATMLAVQDRDRKFVEEWRNIKTFALDLDEIKNRIDAAVSADDIDPSDGIRMKADYVLDPKESFLVETLEAYHLIHSSVESGALTNSEATNLKADMRSAITQPSGVKLIVEAYDVVKKYEDAGGSAGRASAIKSSLRTVKGAWSCQKVTSIISVLQRYIDELK